MKKKIRKIRISLTIAGIVVILAGIFTILVQTKQINFNADEATPTATATISVSPASGQHNVGEEFDASITINGGGQNFTSFSANVAVTNLTIISLTEGPVTQWTTKPSSGSLSFAGGVAGQTNSIKVYTIRVKGDQAGSAGITISGGSVKQTDGYSITDIFSAASGGSFTITSPQSASTGTDSSSSSSPANNASTTNTTVNSKTNTSSNNANTTSTTATSTSATTNTAETAAPASSSTATATTETVVTTSQPTLPTLPSDQANFESAWKKYNTNNDLTLTLVSDNSGAKYDSKTKTLSGTKFKGISSPDTLIALYIFSNKIVKSTTSDTSGYWEITVPESLNTSVHTVYAIAVKDSKTTRATEKFDFNISDKGQVEKVTTAENTIISRAKSWLLDNWILILSSLAVIAVLGFLLYWFLEKRKLAQLQKDFMPKQENVQNITQDNTEKLSQEDELAPEQESSQDFTQNDPKITIGDEQFLSKEVNSENVIQEDTVNTLPENPAPKQENTISRQEDTKNPIQDNTEVIFHNESPQPKQEISQNITQDNAERIPHEEDLAPKQEDSENFTQDDPGIISHEK